MPPIALRLAKLRLVKLRSQFLLSGNSTMVLMDTVVSQIAKLDSVAVMNLLGLDLRIWNCGCSMI